MNIHEYQGKNILSNYGVNVQRGYVADNPKLACSMAEKLSNETGTNYFVVKAQVHAGGRGKGGGIKLAKSIDEVRMHSEAIIGMNLITPQTSHEGKKVNQVLIAEDVYYPGPKEISEMYISVLLNRKSGRNIIVYSSEGGVDIEEVAARTPEKIFKEEIDPSVGLTKKQCQTISNNLGLEDEAKSNMCDFISSLYTAYYESDASLLNKPSNKSI